MHEVELSFEYMEVLSILSVAINYMLLKLLQCIHHLQEVPLA